MDLSHNLGQLPRIRMAVYVVTACGSALVHLCISPLMDPSDKNVVVGYAQWYGTGHNRIMAVHGRVG